MFLLVSYSFVFQYLLCFVHDQGQRKKEIENTNIHKETGGFITSLFQLCAMVRVRMCQVFQLLYWLQMVRF